MEYGEERGGMTGTELKLLAMASMALDHGAYVLLYPLTAGDEALYGFYLALRAAGRLAFPIYAFLLVQGFLQTSGKGRYLARLCAFALISEIPFDLAIAGELVYPGAQNVFVTLAAGMGTLWAMERWGRDRLFPSALMALAGGLAAELLRADYGLQGVLLPAVIYLFRRDPAARMTGELAVLATLLRGPWDIPCLLAVPLTERYNGRRGPRLGLWAYWFYPLHLLAFLGLRMAAAAL